MRRYFLKRCLLVVPTLFASATICFFLTQLLPSGPVDSLLAHWGAQGFHDALTDTQRTLIAAQFDFDKPMWVRYGHWLTRALQFDFGKSYYHDVAVMELLKKAIPVTFLLGVLSLLFTYGIAIPLGILKAVKHRSALDKMTTAALVVFYSVPSFALAIAAIVFLAGGSFWSFFPLGGLTSDTFPSLSLAQKVLDILYHLFLPVLCYSMADVATLTLLTKHALLEELSRDHVRSARARGFSEMRVVLAHALRGAATGVATNLSRWVPFFFTGSLLIETLFNLQGLGRLGFEAITHRDYPVVLATILLISAATVVGNLVSDLLYPLVDPKVRYE